MRSRLNKYRKKIRKYSIDRKIRKYNDKNRETGSLTDFSKHVIVSGEPRGGTTWLMETLLSEKQAVLWEPLHRITVRECKGQKFAADLGFMPYIPEDIDWPEAEDYFKELFSGYLPSGFHHTFRYDRDLEDTDSLMIKFCRANMILPWLTKKLPEIRPIHIVRHPLGVIASQYRMKAFAGMGETTSIFKAQVSRYTQLFDDHADKINAIDSKEAMFANWWAISNLLPLTHPRQNESWLTVSYERLFLQPEEELKRIEDFIGISLPEDSLTKIKKASTSTQPGSGILKNGSQLGTWKKKFSQRQIDTILTIIESYGITAFSDSEEPDYAQLGYK